MLAHVGFKQHGQDPSITAILYAFTVPSTRQYSKARRSFEKDKRILNVELSALTFFISALVSCKSFHSILLIFFQSITLLYQIIILLV